MANQWRILIFDFMNYVHRSRSDKNKFSGQYVLVYKFFRSLRATIDQFKPDKVFFALEGHPKHRYQIYGDYKANRKLIKTASSTVSTKTVRPGSLEFIYQSANYIRDLLSCLPVTLAYHHDFEADDIIASLAHNLCEEQTIIISNDGDYQQLPQSGLRNCRIYNPYKSDFMQALPYHCLTYKALCGDPSDNIKGIVSTNVAQKLCDNSDQLHQFLAIEENRTGFNFNKSLIEFVVLPIDELNFVHGTLNTDRLKQQFIKMEFKSLTDNIDNWNNFISIFKSLK